MLNYSADVVPSVVLSRAIDVGNYTLGDWSGLAPSPTPPATAVDAGINGAYAPLTVRIIPFASLYPSQTFSIRVYGLCRVGSNADTLVWEPFPLAELLCTVGNIAVAPAQPGNDKGIATRYETLKMATTEYRCDDMALTTGLLGERGELLTFGAGSGITAWAIVALRGAEKYYFDFDTLGANCLHAKM